MTGNGGSVLVIGAASTRAFLSVVRSLGRANLEVHVVGVPLDAPALRSRYISGIHALPAQVSKDGTWLAEFKTLLERHVFDLVLPCDDSVIIPLQVNRTAFADCASRIYLLNDRAYTTTSDKQLSYALAAKLGISLPRQEEVSSPDSLTRATSEFGYPVIIKPLSSFTMNNLSIKRMVRKVNDERELMAVGPDMILDGGTVLIQELFHGVGVGVEVLCKDGEILVAFQHERVHEPLSGGGSSYRKSTGLNCELLEATRKLMSALRYTGVCMVEFRYNRESHLWVLIELNGRFWGSLPLALAAGVDFPRYLYELLRHGRTKFPRKYKEHIYCRNWVNDCAWLISNARADLRRSLFKPRSVIKTICEARHILLLRERSDTFVLDDPAPAWFEIRPIIERAFLATVSSNLGLRRRMRNKLTRHAHDCGNVLFVCKGNICRSPFAAGLFAKYKNNPMGVLTAGFHPAGRCAPDVAVRVARDWEVDLEGHRSVLISEEIVRGSDLIFVFDFRNVVAIRALFPAHVSKVVLMGALDDGPLQISDPWGGLDDDFRQVYSRIDSVVSSAIVQMDSALSSGA